MNPRWPLPAWARALPLYGALDDISDGLRSHGAAIVVAPPGTGKSLLVPLQALDALSNTNSCVWLLEPRRLAARAIAKTLSQLLGEPLGGTVGYRVRFEEVGGPQTRLWVVTEGILNRRIEEDPLLDGIGCVILDEVHERSLHTDLALGFVREVRAAREDLWVVAMSATVDPGPLSKFFSQCPVFEAEVRTHPLDIGYLDQRDERPLEARVSAAVASLLSRADDDHGDVLVFLPGAPEIRRCLERLRRSKLPGDPSFVPLYGALPPREQDRALTPDGPRRIVLATNIAQTSLTVPRVTAVVDSGLAKRPKYDATTGLDRLWLGRIAKDAADQRAGRAGRLGPGRALRLWTQAEHQGLMPRTTPDIFTVDLSAAVLQVLSFSPAGLGSFPFFEAPPGPHVEAAMSLLRDLGAVDAREHLTDLGQLMLRLPLPPRLAAAVLCSNVDQRPRTLLSAALLAERDVLSRPDSLAPTDECDLAHRVDLLSRFCDSARTPRDAEALGLIFGAAMEVGRLADRLRGGARTQRFDGADGTAVGPLLLPGFVDRLCRRRAPHSAEVVMVGGRALRLASESAVTQAELLLALDVDAGSRGERATGLIRKASMVRRRDLDRLVGAKPEWSYRVLFDEKRQAVFGVEQLTWRDLVLDERSAVTTDEHRLAAKLAMEARRRFPSVYSPTPEARRLRLRIAFARTVLPEGAYPEVSDEALGAMLDELCHGLRSFEDLRRIDWQTALSSRLTHLQRTLLEREIPERLPVPSGAHHLVDYEAAASGGAPVLAVKLQEMFGCADTPRIANGKVPVVLHLLAPNGRPAQITSDLRGFWNGAYALVRKELRGRYPKHPWPQDPWTALPTAKAKPRGQPK